MNTIKHLTTFADYFPKTTLIANLLNINIRNLPRP